MAEEAGDAKSALEAYQDAASWYEGDGANAYVPYMMLCI